MAHASLLRLERIQDRFGPAYAVRKVALLRELMRRRLGSAREAQRLHEAACFVRAYPDDAAVLAAARLLLGAFANRADLRRFREDLAHTGIAGTTCWFPFFFPSAVWLASRWPRQLRLDRNDEKAGENLADALPVLVTPVEAATLRETKAKGFDAIDRLRARAETDATFLVRRVLAMPGDTTTREVFYDAVNPSCELLPGADTPSRTRAEFPRAPVVFQSTDLRRTRPDLRIAVGRPPRDVTVLATREGRRLVDLARGAMATRKRDLDTFAWGDEREALLVDDGDGLAFGFNGLVPERRAPIAALFGGVTLKNGVPIGYIQVDCVGAHAALSFNTFETFRGGESAHTFARLLAVLRHVFGSTSFSIEPYQLGKDNDEGIASGAWWFYYKLGFRPRDRATLARVDVELARMQRDKGYRSDHATLTELAQRHLFFTVDPRERVFLPPLADLGWRCAALLAERGGADRERAVAALVREALARTGQGTQRGFTDDERRAWAQWAPLVALLPLERWRPPARAALAVLIRAKAATSEREYVTRFAAQARLQQDLWQAARGR